jgi:hypothetical protein
MDSPILGCWIFGCWILGILVFRFFQHYLAETLKIQAHIQIWISYRTMVRTLSSFKTGEAYYHIKIIIVVSFFVRFLPLSNKIWFSFNTDQLNKDKISCSCLILALMLLCVENNAQRHSFYASSSTLSVCHKLQTFLRRVPWLFTINQRH